MLALLGENEAWLWLCKLILLNFSIIDTFFLFLVLYIINKMQFNFYFVAYL